MENKTALQLGFTPCKAEQPLRGMELQEKKAQKRLQDTENLFRKNLELKYCCKRLVLFLLRQSKTV